MNRIQEAGKSQLAYVNEFALGHRRDQDVTLRVGQHYQLI
jgi:hypothetical protein